MVYNIIPTIWKSFCRWYWLSKPLREHCSNTEHLCLHSGRLFKSTCAVDIPSQIAKFMGPTWGPSGSCRPQMGPMLDQWTLLSGLCFAISRCSCRLSTKHEQPRLMASRQKQFACLYYMHSCGIFIAFLVLFMLQSSGTIVCENISIELLKILKRAIELTGRLYVSLNFPLQK